MQRSLREGHVRIVERVRVCQLSVDAKHAGCAQGALVDKVAVDKRTDIETTKVPDYVEDVVESTTDEVTRAKDYL